MKTIYLLVAILFFQNTIFAQDNFNQINADNSVVMTWNKTTPDQEMKDDVKALRDNNGVTIKYSNVKRNNKNEITNIKIEYSDRDGNYGRQEYKNKNAIPEIKFYKNNNEIGFGTPDNNNFGNEMSFGNFGGFDLADLQKQLSKSIKIDTLGNNKNFSFNFNDEKPSVITKNKIIIQKDGKKPLVIVDGKVIEGENDYSKEEIEKIQNENKLLNNENTLKLDSNTEKADLQDLKRQVDQMQQQIQKLQNLNKETEKPSKTEMQTRKM